MISVVNASSMVPAGESSLPRLIHPDREFCAGRREAAL